MTSWISKYVQTCIRKGGCVCAMCMTMFQKEFRIKGEKIVMVSGGKYVVKKNLKNTIILKK